MKINTREIYNRMLDEEQLDTVPYYEDFDPVSVECYDGPEAVLEMVAEKTGISKTQLKEYANFSCEEYGSLYDMDSGFDILVESGEPNWSEFVAEYAEYIKAAEKQWKHAAKSWCCDLEDY